MDTAKEFPEEAKKFEATGSVDGEVVTQESKKQLTIRDTEKSALMDPNIYIQMKAMAQDFIASKAVPKCWESSAQVLVGLQTGVEMGMKPMEAMNSLYPVNGAINVWGKATTRRLKEHGWKIAYKDESQDSCTATVYNGTTQHDGESYTETFTFAEAEQSGYTKDNKGYLKVGWRPGMNRKKKLRYGVLSLIISSYIPEVLGSAVGIVEVSDDYDLGTNKQPAQLEEGRDLTAIAAAYKQESNDASDN